MGERAQIISSVQQFIKDIKNPIISDSVRFKKVKQLFNLTLNRISEETQVLFTSVFARISYVQTALNLKHKEYFLLHTFRKIDEYAEYSIQDKTALGLYCIEMLLSRWLDQKTPHESRLSTLYTQFSPPRNQDISRFQRVVSVEIHEIHLQEQFLIAQLHDEPFDIIKVDLTISDRNEDYKSIIEKLEELNILPIHAHLIDVEIYQDGRYGPSSIVLEPNLLYAVTSIADCFGAFSSHEVGYLLRKFTPIPSSRPLIIGNLANHFLDQLIFNPQLEFNELIPTLFQYDPLGIALLEDAEVREMMIILEEQFNIIGEVVNHQLSNIGIAEDTCLVEPTFYSSKYGIQGRLDLFAQTEHGLTIIELKSGSPFRANAYGLSNTHYHQTLLYDMLIESVYGSQSKRNNYILYSKLKQKPLRYAPALKSQQREAIKVRNKLYLHDRALLKTENIIQYIKAYTDIHRDQIKGFQLKDLKKFLEVFQGLDTIEKSYANLLIRFVLNEWLISKVGHLTREGSFGLSSLWTKNINEKIDQFNIINDLLLQTNQSDDTDPILILKHSEKTAEISNFRIGDLGVLYPHSAQKYAVLRNQIFKITVLALEEKSITVRLRSRQDNPLIFRQHTFWNIEHDHLDNGFTNMTRSVYEWAQAPKNYRDLITGRRPPEVYNSQPIPCSSQLSPEQAKLYSEIINSKEYYLLWGPPGTGKTSILLRELTKYYLNQGNHRILILAYTNRAVDEICKAILSIDAGTDFIRIGSKYSTGIPFQPYLLQSKISHISSRKELKSQLSHHHLYVGTIASVLGKSDLFNILSFDVAIIDEASQILEHALIGILSRVKKFILIGDHQQLPAVVQQSETVSTIDDRDLRNLHFKDLRNSLFERLYFQAQANKWKHAYGKLKQQGRMHEELMSFPSDHFYQSELRVFSKLERLRIKTKPLGTENSITYILSKARTVFIPAKPDTENENIKVNQYEANSCVKIIKSLQTLYQIKGNKIDNSSIGIITPFRAQIALIKKQIDRAQIPKRELITIDTVERYQGGARDIIIMSTCMNYAFQMNSLISLSSAGVDRKLNVALTRARDQFILIGNASILNQNTLYAKWIAAAETINIE